MGKKSFAESMVGLIEYLCARNIPKKSRDVVVQYLVERADIDEQTELSKRQFNEILLLCLETRVTDEYFEYFTERLNKLPMNRFEALIERFKRHSMLKFGNFRFAFKKLTRSKDIKQDLGNWLKDSTMIIDEFKKRPNPILDIQRIDRDKVHKLGYLAKDEKDHETIKMGEYNTNVYLTSDYMDVYVATSMRDETDYQSVFDLCHAVFSAPKIRELNVRYFDPTQSFHKNRMAKGIIEGLMLKRAKCTIYAAQESDSFGKDSELASTLAKGKPVIAFIPKINPNDENYIEFLKHIPLTKLYDKGEICKEYIPEKEWSYFDSIMEKIALNLEQKDDEETARKNLGDDFIKLIKIIAIAEEGFYDYRAKVFQSYHPLGLQMHLETGVANGVLVARTHQECIDLLYDVLTNNLDFDIKKPGEVITCGDLRMEDDLNYRLVEKRSKCVFRVVTTDDLLTNSFWNFYLREDK